MRKWRSDISLGRLANIFLILAVPALVSAYFTPSGGPFLLVSSWAFVGLGGLLGLVDDISARRVSIGRWILATPLFLLLVVSTKIILAAAPAPGVRWR